METSAMCATHKQDLIDLENNIRTEIATALIKENISVERVARCTKVPLEWIIEIDEILTREIMLQAAYDDGLEYGPKIARALKENKTVEQIADELDISEDFVERVQRKLIRIYKEELA